MQIVWKVLAWISIICGLIAYFIGWAVLITKAVIWGVPTEFWFYDAVAAGIFALFFLIYSVHSEKRGNKPFGDKSRKRYLEKK